MVSAAPDGRTPLQRLAAAPHRAFFACGALALLALSLWWSGQMLWPSSSIFAPTLVHGLMMPLGFFPLFMLGFIFTAGPRWLAVPALRGHLAVALIYLFGMLGSLVLFSLGSAWVALSLFAMFLSWAAGTWVWLRCCLRSSAPDKGHALRLFGIMCVGASALLCAVFWAWQGDARWWVVARELSLWGFLLPVFLTVSHRMLPFFTQSALPFQLAWRPWWLLNAWIAGAALLVLAKVFALDQLSAVLAFALAASFAYTSWRWGLFASLSNRLLAMLHLSFAWLAPALLLQSLSEVGASVGTAPVHALALGFFFTMLIGFVTRVSLGHSGRPLAASNFFWLIYLGFHAVAVTRVALAIAQVNGWPMHATAAAWTLLLLLWVGRLLPIYLAARADGKAD